MAGGGAPAPKQDELQPHPVKDQLPGVSYCITSPPPWREFSDFVSFYLSNFLFICGNIKKKKGALKFRSLSRESLGFLFGGVCLVQKLTKCVR